MVAHFLLRPWLAISVALLLGTFLFRRIKVLFQLRHIKGPLLSRISGIPHALAVLSGDCPSWYLELNQKYGQIAVLSPTMLLTSSPDLWARSNTHPGYKKSKWFYRAARFDWRNDNIFTETDTEKHDARRNQMVRGYSGAENLTLDADIESCVTKLLHLVGSRYAGKRKLDLAQKITFYTLDVISTIGLGKSYDLLDTDADPSEYIKSTHMGLKVSNIQVALGTWWVNWIPFVGPKTDLNIETTKGFYKMVALNASRVEGREREFNQQKSLGAVPRADMLTSFLKNGISGEELKAEIMLQIVAGSDTTAAALKAVLLYVMTNPRVYKILQVEIDDAVESGIAPQRPAIIKPTQAKGLRYLQAVIKEAMRLCPAVQNPLSRDTPPEGDTVVIDGEEVYLPGGVNIVPSFKAMQRNKSVYGEDADVDIFRPERWLEEGDQQRLEAMTRDFNLGFGHGRWQCLGKAVALRQLGIVIFELLRHFNWAIVNPEKPWKNEILLGLHVTNDMWVHAEERK
ncbi:cytochrome protein [Nemania diffusa]|nr:cytochrome protein [Nemania diffusa]